MPHGHLLDVGQLLDEQIEGFLVEAELAAQQAQRDAAAPAQQLARAFDTPTRVSATP